MFYLLVLKTDSAQFRKKEKEKYAFPFFMLPLINAAFCACERGKANK